MDDFFLGGSQRGQASGMDRKVEKLTEVLVFADSAGLEFVIRFYQWFEELASETPERSGHEILILVSAASRVLKKLFIAKIRALSAIDFDRRVFTGCFPEIARERINEIRTLLIGAMKEAAQEAEDGPMFQTRWESGGNDIFELQGLVSAQTVMYSRMN